MAINNAINQYPIVDSLLGSWTPGAGAITSADSILTAMQKISGSSVSLSGNNVWTGTNSFGNTVTFSTLTASTVPYLDASKNLTSSAVTPTELGYVSGVTSAIQTQLNAKAPTASPTFTGTVTIPTPFTLGAVSVTTTGTQLNYINIATGTTGTGNIVFSATPTLTGGILFSDSVSSVSTNTSDGSDSKAITIAGGGAYGTTRGSGIAVIGNEYATIGGDLELMAGDSAVSGAIKFYVGDGAGNALLAGSIARTSMLTTFNGSVVANSTLSVASTLTVGGQATATSVGMEIGNTAGGTPFIDFKSSAVDYNVRIINGTSTTLSFLGATGGYFFDTTVNSIYSIVATTATATLTTITQGITTAGNLVTSAYVANGYTAGLTWSSTDDNASKPKAGIFSRTTGSGTYIILGTSNAYATGIVNTVSIGPDGDIAANRYSATSTATTQNVIFAQGDNLTTGKLGYFYSNSGDTNSRSLVSIVNDSSAATGTTVLNLQQDANAGAFTITSANTTTSAFQITASSLTTGRGAYIYSKSSSDSQFVLLDLTSDNASATGMIPLAIANAASVSTNYKIMMYLGGVFIWKSAGVTPNGNLTGTAGDICLGADSGKAYYCAGGHSWTAM